MATAVTKFKSQDGKEFDTELEADGHDASLANAGVIEAFITAAGVKKAQAGALRNQLPKFLAFQKSYVPPAADGAAEGSAA